MITKFKTIKNLAVFQNFIWDTVVRDDGNNVALFKEINIFYGRNYSGKTTLSRIIRALEKGKISDKYENPEFEVSVKDASDTTLSNLTAHGMKIRVFNEDFVKDNLRFIINSDESINPFAVLGGNSAIEAEIKTLKDELGVDIEEAESGFYLELKNANQAFNLADKNYKTERDKLDQQLTAKATNRQNGIKYKSEKFGDQNYTKPKLESDINFVLDATFKPLTNEEIKQKLALLNEKVNSDIQAISKPNVDFKSLTSRTENLVTKPVSGSNKIEELIRDLILNRWVKEGRQLHRAKPDNCSFCGNGITEERWKKLDRHFDEESEKLEGELDQLIQEIQKMISSIDSILLIDKTVFYSKFHDDLERLILIRSDIIDHIKGQLKQAEEQLLKRKNDLLNPKTYSALVDKSKRLDWCFKIFENFRVSANSYTSSIDAEQTEAKRLLRLREVSEFAETIHYSNEVTKIQRLKSASEEENQRKIQIEQKIDNQKKLIAKKERLMNDEERGALKVNEYLNNFFGHDFLTLQALGEADSFGGKKIRFEIIRHGKKAHHLSEGECSLIAFCYFMAKLEDIDTKGSQPIIWIDDPISSLDSNHIFFVYSLINSEIVTKENFQQLFITTHNLDFLKYLKRLPGALNKKKAEYFLISREEEKSKIKLMPKYLKEYITEFNYLFHQIYLSANADTDDESQHSLFYNFGNNTRKFLEAFLFYKYPNAVNHDDKLTRFFGEDKQAASLTERITNELSHLEGLFERSMTPIEIPEMKKTAKFILAKIQEKDADQYEALVKSISVETI